MKINKIRDTSSCYYCGEKKPPLNHLEFCHSKEIDEDFKKFWMKYSLQTKRIPDRVKMCPVYIFKSRLSDKIRSLSDEEILTYSSKKCDWAWSEIEKRFSPLIKKYTGITMRMLRGHNNFGYNEIWSYEDIRQDLWISLIKGINLWDNRGTYAGYFVAMVLKTAYPKIINKYKNKLFTKSRDSRSSASEINNDILLDSLDVDCEVKFELIKQGIIEDDRG